MTRPSRPPTISRTVSRVRVMPRRPGARRRPYRPGGNTGAAASVEVMVIRKCRWGWAQLVPVGSAGQGGAGPAQWTGSLSQQRGRGEPVGEQLRLMAVHAHPDDESSKG